MLKDINLIGIAGAGTMGSGIAQIFARFGKFVVINDIKEEYLTKSRNLIDIFNKSLIEEGLMNEK
jgi:3-hydroxyacyl-CoA dehydrogenase